MTHPAFRDKGSKLYLPCGTRDRVCKSGTVPDVSGRLAAMKNACAQLFGEVDVLQWHNNMIPTEQIFSINTVKDRHKSSLEYKARITKLLALGARYVEGK